MEHRLVYWGTGNISKLCLKQYPNIRPEFFIDSNWERGTFYNIPVKRPNEIRNWNELFVVIVTMAFRDIEIVLNSKGLIRNQHYTDYEGFFNIKNRATEENITFLEDLIEKNEEYKNASLIIGPVFSSRESEKMIHFFREYSLKRLPEKCILLSYLSITNEEHAQKVMGYPVIDLPEISKWDGRAKENISEKIGIIHTFELSENERNWIDQLENRMLCDDKELSYTVTAEIYWYFKRVFSILQPQKVIIWSGWSRTSHIIAQLAENNHVLYGFMEYGWIPGTFQFERGGIAGQSEYAVNPNKILRHDVKIENTEIKNIRNYIITSKIDSGKFRKNEDDERNLKRINKKQKIIFFVGMDDYGIGINPQSRYWEQYISSVFSSTLEAVSFLSEVSKKNNWNLIFKPHPNPADKNKLDENTLEQSVIQVKYMEIDRLIQISDAVVSIASAVDYKTLIYGKPLVQLGHTTLAGKGCSYEVNNISEVEEQLKAALEQGMTKEQNRNFELHMAQLLENYLWDDLSDRELRYGLPLEKDFFDRGSDT